MTLPLGRDHDAWFRYEAPTAILPAPLSLLPPFSLPSPFYLVASPPSLRPMHTQQHTCMPGDRLMMMMMMMTVMVVVVVVVVVVLPC